MFSFVPSLYFPSVRDLFIYLFYRAEENISKMFVEKERYFKVISRDYYILLFKSFFLECLIIVSN